MIKLVDLLLFLTKEKRQEIYKVDFYEDEKIIKMKIN
jgi:hypothetical protein